MNNCKKCWCVPCTCGFVEIGDNASESIIKKNEEGDIIMGFEEILKMFKLEEIKENNGKIHLHKERLKVFRESWLKGRTNSLEYKYVYRCPFRSFRKVIKGKENKKACEYSYCISNTDLMSEDWAIYKKE